MFNQSKTHLHVSTLGELCRSGGHIFCGIANTSATADGIPVVMPENINDDKIDSVNSLRKAPKQKFGSTKRLQTGDLVCSRRGDLHRRALIFEGENGWLCGSGCFQVRTGTNLNSKYLFYYLAHPSVKTWIQKRAVGVTMPHTKINTYTSLPVLVPSMDQQIEIASTLSLLDEKIALNFEMNRNLDRCAQEIIKGMLGARVSDTHSAVVQSENLVEKALRQICLRIENGRTPVRTKDEYWNPPTIPWLNSKEVRQPVVLRTLTSISPEGLRRSFMKIWPQNTIIVSLCGEVAGNVSILAIDACANQGCCGLILPDGIYVYVYFYLRMMRHHLTRLKNGTTIQNLNQTALASFPIVFPVGERIEVVSKRLRPLLERIRHNMLEVESLRAIRDRLISKLVMGITFPHSRDSRRA